MLQEYTCYKLYDMWPAVRAEGDEEEEYEKGLDTIINKI